jgi:hypothetical protein
MENGLQCMNNLLDPFQEVLYLKIRIIMCTKTHATSLAAKASNFPEEGLSDRILFGNGFTYAASVHPDLWSAVQATNPLR